MKHLSVFLLSLVSVAAFAQWSNSGLAPGSTNTGFNRVPASVTQSLDTSTITALNSVACPADNDSYMRRFDLTVDGITTSFNVESIDFGIETATALGLTVNLYTIPKASPLTFANLTLIGTAPFAATAAQSATVQNAPVIGLVADPMTVDLVVEIFAPDFTNGATFFVGSNAGGQTAPSYLASAGCGAAEPTDTAVLGFPGMHVIMVVNGDILATIPTLGEWGLLTFVFLLMASAIVIMRKRRLAVA